MSKSSRVRFQLFVSWNIHTVVFLYLIVFYFLVNFSHQRQIVVFHRSLRDSKFPQASMTPLRILNNAIVRMILILPLISNSSSLFSRPLWNVPFFFILWSSGLILRNGKFFYFLSIITRSDVLAGIKWFVGILKSPTTLSVSFSRTDSTLCIYHLFVWSNVNFLHNSQWITFSAHSCLALYSFCACLQYLIIISSILLLENFSH